MPKILDLTNYQFGKLKVLYKTKSSKHGYYWLCQCECGNKIEVLGTNLKSGNTKSCGCLVKEKRQNIKNTFQSKNITNCIFGEWIALYQTNKKSSSGSYYWHCRCSCGNEKDVDIGSLTSRKSKSCGCIKSFGEKKILSILKENQIEFKQEFTFTDCKTENDHLCRFDFAIFENDKLKYLIEYDGKQHFEEGIFNLSKNQLRDKIKNNYCLSNKILLYRIPYTDLNQINNISDIINDKYLVVQ